MNSYDNIISKKDEMAANLTEIAENYIFRITQRKGHFSFLQSTKDTVAIFGRLGFVPPDEWTMIRIRLLSETVPKVQTSVLNGFFVGTIRIDRAGRIVRGFNKNEWHLLNYLLHEYIGAHTVQKEGDGVYRILYPDNLVEILLASGSRLAGKKPDVQIRGGHWHITVGAIHFEIERFREWCMVKCSPDTFLKMIGVDGDGRERFVQLTQPCILCAFGTTIHVDASMSFNPAMQAQLSDRIFAYLFAKYEKVRKQFISGRYLTLSKRWSLPEITTVSKPALLRLPVGFTTRTSPCVVRSSPRQSPMPKIPSCADSRVYREVIRQQYQFLKDCLEPQAVKLRFRGRRLNGCISRPDSSIYAPIWSVDHFFNALAMLDFDAQLAKKMAVGGFIHWMRLSGKDRGQIPLKQGKEGTAYPIWAPVVREIFLRTKDRKFVEEVFPFLKMDYAFHERNYFRKGIYVGAGGNWNDYSTGPKNESYVAGIGMNSLIVLQQQIMCELGEKLGENMNRFRHQYEICKDKINELFWDDNIGFYFDYDADKEDIFTTSSGSRFWGLDNLLPLFAGIVPQSRIKKMERYLLSSHYYGRYPAFTTDLSPDYMDERRLQVWVMTNYLVIMGLRKYRLDKLADSVSMQIFNAMLRNWVCYRKMPESLSGYLGLAPMENPNLAGVGCWTGFYLFMKEAVFKTSP